MAQVPTGHRRIDASERRLARGARRIGPASPNEVLSISFRVRPRPDAPPLPDQEYWARTPPAQRKFASRHEFGIRHGALQADLDKVADFARAHGLSGIQTNAARRTVIAAGTVAQMDKMFTVELGAYESAIEKYRSYEGVIFLPPAVADLVEFVLGLDNRRIGRRSGNGSTFTITTLTPPQVGTLHNFPAAPNLANQTIGLLEFDSLQDYQAQNTGFNPTDINDYFGSTVPGSLGPGFIPPASVTPILVNGATYNPTPPFGSTNGEITGDIEFSGAIAQGVNIAVYFSTIDENGWFLALTTAIYPDASLNQPSPTVLSISYAFPEINLAGSNWTSFMTVVFQEAAAAGITVLAGSGDYGTDCGVEDGKAHVEWPASDPWVTACGGTAIGNVSGTMFSEVAWTEVNDPGAATGGGISDVFPLPSWQQGIVTQTSVNDGHVGRGVPDIAGYANGYPWVFQAQSGISAGMFHGTSETGPYYAGLIAVINATLGWPVGYLNPILYALYGTQVFLDIDDGGTNAFTYATGTSPGYTAGVGWDACTGLGSIFGGALLTALRSGTAQACYFIVDQAIFGEGAVASELLQSPAAVFDDAFFVVVDGFTPNQLGITPGSLSNPTVRPQFSPALPSGMSFVFDTVQPADASLLSSNANAAQRFTYVYNVQFGTTAGFPVAPAQTLPLTITATVTASVSGNNVSASAAAAFELNSLPDPYFAGGSGISWLSADLRVFELEAGTGQWTLQDPPNPPVNTGLTLQFTGDPTSDATNFIQQVIQKFNSPTEPAPPNHPFDLLPTNESASLDTLPFDPATNNFVFNFAVARVRYDASAVNAQSVRVFFRLIPALSTSVAYDPTTNYRRWSDGVEFGQAIPLLGIDPNSGDVLTIPCFASPRIDVTQAAMTTQTDTANVQPINGNAGNETYAYFGCWLDLNQTDQVYPANDSLLPASVPLGRPDGPFPLASLQDIETLIANQHQCLVAEIAFDPSPIPEGLSPSTSGPLAQRNLSLIPAANPGDVGSRRVPNTFTIRPTSPSLKPGERPDELMIDWGNTPSGSVASIYWPAVSAAEVLRLATRMYATHSLTKSDAHTLEIPVGGITYIPIPRASGASIPGLISVDLPSGIRKGQVFNIVVRQVTGASEPRKTDRAVKPPTWRRILGSFQISIPVKTKAEMLAPEERALSVLRWTEKKIPASSRWFSVFRRYVGQVAERFRGLGGNPLLVLPSPTGGVTPPSAKPPKHGTQTEFTGKVVGLKYDGFGDFEGFILHTEQGDERFFQGRDHKIEELVDRAWKERIVISVFVQRHDPDRPESIVLRRAPRPS